MAIRRDGLKVRKIEDGSVGLGSTCAGICSTMSCTGLS